MKKVSLVRCESYELNKLKDALRQSVENLEGFGPYIKSGEKILLKPNLLAKRKPESAVTVNPVFVRALTELLIEYGCTVLMIPFGNLIKLFQQNMSLELFG